MCKVSVHPLRTIVSEMVRAVSREFAVRHARRIKRITVVWCAVGAFAILSWLFAYQLSGGTDKPPLLLAILTPANLFTGVLGCGLFCLLNLWMDRRFLPETLRLPGWLWWLNLVSGLVFIALGLKGYWDDQSRWYAIGSLGAMLLIAAAGAHLAGRWSNPADERDA